MMGPRLTSAQALLAAGALLGAGIASWQLVGRGPDAGGAMPAGAIAVVNGSPIWSTDYDRALSGVAAATGRPPDQATRRRVLERLIEEELLVQRGLELGLAARDRRVRADLSAAVIGLLVASAEDGEMDDEVDDEVDDAELRRFHADNARWFRGAPQLAVEALYFRAAPDDDGAALERATLARARLAGGVSIDELRAAADEPDVAIPSGPVTPRALGDLIGSTATRAALTLQPGEVSEPVRATSGYFVVRLRARLDGQSPPFDEIRDAVAAERRRRAGERGLERFLDERRAAADIRLGPEAP